MKIKIVLIIGLILFSFSYIVIAYENYDYRPPSHPGYMAVDMNTEANGQNAHDGRGLIELRNGNIMLIYSNTTGHNIDGWSEYKISTDHGETWGNSTKLQISYNEYNDGDDYTYLSEGSVVTDNGTIIIFLTNWSLTPGTRNYIGYIRSFDNGNSFTGFSYLNTTTPNDVDSTGYDPFSHNGTVYVICDSGGGTGGYHKLYVSTDNGSSFSRRSVLPFGKSNTYWDIDLMSNNDIIAISFLSSSSDKLYYCISHDYGYTWDSVQTTDVNKSIRNPQMVRLGDYYFLHGRSGNTGGDGYKGVIYTSTNGINWDNGVFYDNVQETNDWYSCNEIIYKYNSRIPNKILVQYSDQYNGDVNQDCNVLTFFIENISGTEIQEEIIEFISIQGKTNQSIIYSSTPTINWTIVSNASLYWLQIDNNQDFSSPEANYTNINQWNYPVACDINATRVSFTLPSPLTEYNKYYMRVRAYTE